MNLLKLVQDKDYFVLTTNVDHQFQLVGIENLDASNVALTDSEFSELDMALEQCTVYGHRGFSR